MTLAARPLPELDHDIHAAEAARLDALDRFDILDTPREEGLDGIVRLIRNIFRAPIGIVSVIDAHRQWYKACDGLSQSETPRRDTFCDLTIRSRKQLVVEDASKDARFAANPHVAGAPHIRFYAGVPLTTRDGHAIGTLCVVDTKPRVFGAEQLEILNDLAKVAMAELNLRQHVQIDLGTGLLSRRALMEEGDGAIALARRHDMELSAVMIGLDGVPQDLAARDEIIAVVAKTLRRNLRRTDIVGRVGGENFAVVLPNTGSRGAFDAAEKLRSALKALSTVNGERAPRFEARVGAATLDTDVDDIDDLLARAESALAEAKAGDADRSVPWRAGAERERPALRRVLKAGTIHFNNRMSTVDCTVRALSGAGAGLDLSSSFGLPERFGLTIHSEGLDRSCRIVSQSERHVEVEFV